MAQTEKMNFYNLCYKALGKRRLRSLGGCFWIRCSSDIASGQVDGAWLLLNCQRIECWWLVSSRRWCRCVLHIPSCRKRGILQVFPIDKLLGVAERRFQ